MTRSSDFDGGLLETNATDEIIQMRLPILDS